VTRTLLAAGFEVSAAHRHPSHIAIEARRTDALGATLSYFIALSDDPELSRDECEAISREAARRSQTAVIVTPDPRQEGLWSLENFLAILGGAVPSWRALDASYAGLLQIASLNQKPPGTTGEPWFVFENLAADGLEFALGRRVRRLGGYRRGKPVSDMIGQLPDTSLLVIDAKAAKDGFDATPAALRPLGEYVTRQVGRQRGDSRVYGALVVSSGYHQTAAQLAETSRFFHANCGAPVAFLTADVLSLAIAELRENPTLRIALRWRHLLAGGFVDGAAIHDEIEAASDERVTRERR